MNRERLRKALPYFAFGSGACALVYESLWMRSFGLIFGNTTHAIAAILAVFMGGLALGSFLTSRLYFKKTVKAYALVEMGIGAFALLTIPLLYFLPQWYGAFVRAHGLSPAPELIFRLIGATLILLPPTVLLGMTFPLLVEFLTRSGRNFYANMGFLYRTNTLGGAFGVFLATFFLVPSMGKLGTFIVAAATNLAIGLLAWNWGKDLQDDSKQKPQPKASKQTPTTSTTPPAPVSKERLPLIFLLTAFSTGLFSFGLEILWTRSLALVIGSSIYSFNIMLIALLLGIVSGALIYEFYWTRIKRPVLWLSVIILIVGLLCLIDMALIGFLPVISFALIKALPVSFFLNEAAGFLLCLLTMFIVTMPLGFLFPLLTHFLKLKLYSPQKISSHLYVWNTLGTIVGSLGTAFMLVPLFGLQTSFVLLAVLPLALGLWFLGESLTWPAIARAGTLIIVILISMALVSWYQPWDLYTMTAGIYKYGIDWRDGIQSAWSLSEFLRGGRQILFYKEGDEGVVCVTQTGDHRIISVNGKSDAGNGQDVITQRLIAHVPLMLHPNPRKALVIGWGSGTTAGSASLYPSLDQIDCVEIEPLMFTCRQYFADVNHNVASDPRFRIHIQDGRNYLLTTPTRYDVIVSEPSNPWITGVSNLFTREFYSIAKSRLNEGGIFCQWFHYYNISLEDMKAQSRTFAKSFPYASMWLVPPQPVEIGSPVLYGDIFFIGSDKPYHLDYERVKHWYSNNAIREDLVPLGGVEDELAFFCNYFMNRNDMLSFAGGAPDNSDNFPYLEFSAPKGLYLAQTEAERSIVEIYRALDNGGSEEFPPIENYPPLAEKNLTKKQHADLCVSIGTQYLHKAFRERARRLAETAIREDDQNASAYSFLGETLYSYGVIAEAEKMFLKALSLTPKLQRPYHILGAMYYNGKEFSKAAQMYSQLVVYFPDDPIGYLGLAVIYTDQRNWIQAREMVNKALSIDPKLEDALKLQDFLGKQIK